MIADALFRLMKRKPFRQISVTEICEEAAIGRKTFYRNFELREDVIDFQLDLMRDKYQMEIEELPIEKRLFYHFSYIKKNSAYFISLYRNGLEQLAYDKFDIVLPGTMPIWSDDEVEQEYRSAYITAGIEAIQRVWISRGCKESIEEVVQVARRAQEKQIPIR